MGKTGKAGERLSWLCVMSPVVFCFFYTFLIQFQPINNSKITVAILTSSFILVTLFLIAVLFIKYRALIHIDRHNLAFIIPIAILFCYAFISLLWSPERTSGLIVLAQLATGMSLASIITVSVHTKKHLDWLMLGFFIYFLAILLVGTWETFTHTYFLNHKSYMAHTKNDMGLYLPSVGFLNTNNFAFVLVCLAPLVFYNCVYGMLKSHQWLLLPVAVLFAFNLLNTESRPGYVMLVFYIAALIFGLFLAKKTKLALILLLCLLFGSIALLLTFPTYPIKLFNSIFSPTQRPDSSDNIRLKLYKAGLSIWKSHPFGIGAGASPAAVGEHLSSSPLPLHLMYLTQLVEYGIVGPLSCLTALLFPLVQFIKSFFRDSESRPVCLLFIVAGLSFFLMSLSPSDASLIFFTWITPSIWLAVSRIIVKK